MKKNPTWKRMRCVFFLQTSNLHANKQKYKSEGPEGLGEGAWRVKKPEWKMWRTG